MIPAYQSGDGLASCGLSRGVFFRVSVRGSSVFFRAFVRALQVALHVAVQVAAEVVLHGALQTATHGALQVATYVGL